MSDFLGGFSIIALAALTIWNIAVTTKRFRVKNIDVDEHRPTKSNKNKTKIVAMGSIPVVALLQLPYAKTTLDVVYYNWHIDLYTPVNIAFFLLMITTNMIVGGTYLTNLKGNNNGQ